MDPNETMVEENFDDVPADDAPEEGITEETDESESLDSVTEEEEAQPAEETPKNEPQGTSEPGWIKKRVEKAVSRAVAETEARMQAMFDQQMAPIREKMLTEEAKELVRQGEFKSLDRAKEYLQLKQGMQPAQAPNPARNQPRDASGRFVQRDDPAITARIDMLRHQADSIKNRTGLDVIAEYNRNPAIKEKIVSGDMDFYDVAEQMKSSPTKRKPPSPMRSPNGASGTNPNGIEAMSDEQFRRLEKRIKEGARIKLN